MKATVRILSSYRRQKVIKFPYSRNIPHRLRKMKLAERDHPTDTSPTQPYYLTIPTFSGLNEPPQGPKHTGTVDKSISRGVSRFLGGGDAGRSWRQRRKSGGHGSGDQWSLCSANEEHAAARFHRINPAVSRHCNRITRRLLASLVQ